MCLASALASLGVSIGILLFVGFADRVGIPLVLGKILGSAKLFVKFA
jgi:hypothetical protein